MTFCRFSLLVLYSVGSPLPPNQPRSSVHMLRGWFTAALGDFHTFRHALLLTRQVKLFCLLFSLVSRGITNTTYFQKKKLLGAAKKQHFTAKKACNVKAKCSHHTQTMFTSCAM